MRQRDAASLCLGNGNHAVLATYRGSTTVLIVISDMMQSGHISLPNGLGMDFSEAPGRMRRVGVAPNELTVIEDSDFLAYTP